MVAPKVLGDGVEGIADKGRGDADLGHQTIVGLLLGEESKDEKAQQGTIGITGQRIDGIDKRGGVECPEQEDKHHEDQAHHHMHLFSQRLIVWLTTDVHAEAGGERSQGRVGTRESGCHNA